MEPDWTEGEAAILKAIQGVIGIAVLIAVFVVMIVAWSDVSPVLLVPGALLGGAALTWLLQLAIGLVFAAVSSGRRRRAS